MCKEGKYNFTGMAQVGNYLYAIATEYRLDCSAANCSCLNFFSPAALADFVNCVSSNGTTGTVSTIFERAGFCDDLDAETVYGTKVIVAADYIKGTPVCVKDNGYKQSSPLCESDFALFDCPSSVTFGKSLNYSSMNLIITEKGMVFEHQSGFGNKVSGMSIE